MSNDQAFAKLQGAIDRLATLGTLPAVVAAAAVEPLRAQLTANIAAGVGPGGKAWPLTADGRKALQNAAAALQVTSTGPTLIARLNGVEARHNNGNVKGKIKRQILPTRGTIGGVAKILHTIATQKWRELAAGDK